MRFLVVYCLMGAALTGPIPAQQHLSVQTETPEVAPYEGTRVWSALARKYLPTGLAHTTFVNSSRLESLMRAGNIYLSLQDAIALALENNLDIEYHRYDRRQSETDQLRAAAGQLLRFSGGGIRAGFSSATSGVLSGTTSLGGSGGGGGGGQQGILSGFTIQAAGSSIPHLEPLAVVSWKSSANTRILNS